MEAQTIIEYGARLLIIFMILPIHEFAHAYCAYKLGDNTALYKGRLTMNPLAHIDLLGAFCLLFTGFGWAKPVPVNPLKFKKYRRDMALTSLAGPLSNVIVAFLATIGFRFAIALNNDKYMLEDGIIHYMPGTNDEPIFYLILLLYFFISVNIGLAIFNMIPIPPLDGSKILSYFTSAKYEKFLYENQMMIRIVFIVAVASGILSKPLGFLGEKVFDFFILITNWIEKLV